MKNKIVFIGILCLIMAFGLALAGCNQEAEPAPIAQISAPTEVVYNANNKKLTWTAQAEGVVTYQVVYSKEGQKSQQILPGQSGNPIIPKQVTNANSLIDHVDKWEADLNSVSIKGTFRIGVRAVPTVGSDPSVLASPVTWINGTVTFN